MFGWLKRVTGRGDAPAQAPADERRLSDAVLAKRYLALVRAGGLRARYDAASTTENNRRHWAHADSLSADASATADIRQTLRNRSRYEVANNSCANAQVALIAGWPAIRPHP